jgi:hypothetical protein
MAVHREEGTFTIRIDLVAEFDEAYEGDDDGYAWLDAWKANVRPRVVKALFDALRSDAAFDAIPVTRGRAPDENVDVEVRLRPGSTGRAASKLA